MEYGVETEVEDESHGSSRNGMTQDLVEDDADDDADDADSDDPPERNNVPILETAERNVTGTQKRKVAWPNPNGANGEILICSAERQVIDD